MSQPVALYPVQSRNTRIIRGLVTAALMIALISQVDVGDALGYLLRANPGGLVLAMFILVCDRFLQAAKWYPLVRIQTDKLPLDVCIRAYLASYAASFLLPASIGADMLRAVALGRGRNLIPEVSASIVMERLLGVATLVIANLLAVLYAFSGSARLERFGLLAAGLVGVALVALLLPMSRPLHRWIRTWCERFQQARWSGVLRRFGDAYYAHRRHPATLLLVFGLSLVEIGMIILMMATVSEAIGTRITLSMLLVVAPIALVLYRLPFTYWGLGVADGGLVLLLKHLYGIPPTEALAASAAFRFVELCVALPGAILWPSLLGPAGLGRAVDARATRV
ncbi:MAG TPA: lysylphosphatidylglycerol synthase transmembrane domain-containing protein [Gemmatimonadales bacterium]|nr:lysylphosphatidylglycerol synthase transmembrane domain-containing protein [Gemmatimonadales bacterium]